jgi:protein-S-isoprenylcysteine O-methyltransferase Ste14
MTRRQHDTQCRRSAVDVPRVSPLTSNAHIRRPKVNKNLVIELATYIAVPFLMCVASPILGKWIDTIYFPYPNVLAISIPVIVLGVLLLIGGATLGVWTIYLLKTIGQGTPNPTLPPKVFVVRGPYRFSRNPMALGGLLIMLGEAALYYSPSLLGLAIMYGLVIYWYIVLFEEPVLRARFGKPYADYLERVPRFFSSPLKWHR